MPSGVLGSVLKLALSLLKGKIYLALPTTLNILSLFPEFLVWCGAVRTSWMQPDTVVALRCYYVIVLELCGMVFPRDSSEGL